MSGWRAMSRLAPSVLLAVATAGPELAQSAHSRHVQCELREHADLHAIKQGFERWARGGSSFFDETLSPDVVWTIQGSGPSAGTFRGREEFVQRAVLPFVSRLSTPVRPVTWRAWADGEHVIVNWHGRGVALDGVDYRNDYVWILRMLDGKAVEVTAFLDLVPYDDVLRRIPAQVAQ